MKYYIDLTNIEKIGTIEIEARNEKEATTKAIEKVNDGGGFVYSNEILINNIEYDVSNNIETKQNGKRI